MTKSLDKFIAARLVSKTSETINYHPLAAAHQTAPIFEFVRAFDHILLR